MGTERQKPCVSEDPSSAPCLSLLPALFLKDLVSQVLSSKIKLKLNNLHLC